MFVSNLASKFSLKFAGVALGVAGLMAASGISQASYFAYIPEEDGNTLQIINGTTQSLVGQVDFVDTGCSNFVAILPAGNRVYVSSDCGLDSVFAVDTASGTVTEIPTGVNGIQGIAAHPDGSTVYVAAFNDDVVQVISTASNQVTGSIPVGVNPGGVAVSPDGTRLYVGNFGGTVSVVDTATELEITKVPAGIGAGFLDVSPDNTRVYVTNSEDDTVTVIDATTNTAVTTLPAGDGPYGVLVLPDNSAVYVTNTFDDSVTVIDPATNTVADTLTLSFNTPEGIDISPDASLLFIANRDGSFVSLLDPADNSLVNTIPLPVDSFPVAVGKFIGPEFCGNGAIDAQIAGEQCEGGECCDPRTCTFEPAGTSCDQGQGQCDAAGACVPPTPPPTNIMIGGGGCSLGGTTAHGSLAWMTLLLGGLSLFLRNQRAHVRYQFGTSLQ